MSVARALTVHGPAGVVDLVVPAGATVGEVAGAYAEQCRLPGVPGLRRGAQGPLSTTLTMADLAVEAGELLVVEGALDLPRRPREPTADPESVSAAQWRGRGASVLGPAGLLLLTLPAVVVVMVVSDTARPPSAPAVVWAGLLLLAVTAARCAPALCVNAGPASRLDPEIRSVSAWSTVEVGAIARRGARLLTVVAAAVLGLCAVASPMLLATATLPWDRVGARAMVALVGASLLLAANGYRHRPPRRLLRGAGVTCWSALLLASLADAAETTSVAVGLTGIAVSVLLMAGAVATGRGWRSARWSRAVEVGDGLANAGAIAALVVASGLLRTVMELQFNS